MLILVYFSPFKKIFRKLYSYDDQRKIRHDIRIKNEVLSEQQVPMEVLVIVGSKNILTNKTGNQKVEAYYRPRYLSPIYR